MKKKKANKFCGLNTPSAGLKKPAVKIAETASFSF